MWLKERDLDLEELKVFFFSHFFSAVWNERVSHSARKEGQEKIKVSTISNELGGKKGWHVSFQLQCYITHCFLSLSFIYLFIFLLSTSSQKQTKEKHMGLQLQTFLKIIIIIKTTQTQNPKTMPRQTSRKVKTQGAGERESKKGLQSQKGESKKWEREIKKGMLFSSVRSEMM